MRSIPKFFLASSIIAVLAFSVAPAAEAHDASGSLSFKGWGLTQDRLLVSIYGNEQQYTAWPYADLSGLGWDLPYTSPGGLAAHPWDSLYLFVLVPKSSGWANLYRFDIVNQQTSFVTAFPPPNVSPSLSYLQGLGSQCYTKLKGKVGFSSHRSQGTGNYSHVRKLSTAGDEVGSLVEHLRYKRGDNAVDLTDGPHWFTMTHEGTWGMVELIGNQVGPYLPMGEWSERPTGLLSHWSPGAFYLSTVPYFASATHHLYYVDTNTASATPLEYVVWGEPALEEEPVLVDLANRTAHCRDPLP